MRTAPTSLLCDEWTESTAARHSEQVWKKYNEKSIVKEYSEVSSPSMHKASCVKDSSIIIIAEEQCKCVSIVCTQI